MKRVIRRGTFETNSSSTHSLSIEFGGCKPTDEVDKNTSFEIRTPFAKAVQMLGLISNAESDFERIADEIDMDDPHNTLKQAVVDKINGATENALGSLNVSDITAFDLAVKITPYVVENFASIMGSEDDPYMYFFTMDTVYRYMVNEFKNEILNELCKIEEITMEQALEKIEFEAFANHEIVDILKDEATARERLEQYKERNYGFKLGLENSEEDILTFAKKYLYDDMKRTKQLLDTKVGCDMYFCHGCLSECTCGFETYGDICNKLNFDFETESSKIRLMAKKYMSNNCKIVAIENYCGFYLEGAGEIY